MNPDAITIIALRQEIVRAEKSNQRPPIFKSCTALPELGLLRRQTLNLDLVPIQTIPNRPRVLEKCRKNNKKKNIEKS